MDRRMAAIVLLADGCALASAYPLVADEPKLEKAHGAGRDIECRAATKHGDATRAHFACQGEKRTT